MREIGAPTRCSGAWEQDLEKVEETLTWLRGPDRRTYVKIHSTVYTAKRGLKGCEGK